MTREEALAALRESVTEAEELIADGIDPNADDALVSVSVSTARALLSPSEREEKLEAAAKRLLVALRLQDEALEQSDAIDIAVCDAHRDLDRLIFPPMHVTQDAPADGVGNA